ncbi:WapI family immunity protein [Rubrivivax gelatinosus]|uniref:Uncharacterized protein n=3 Tax=Rubrivivax gelatinosus TaxID=28068 RepID=A0A4R2LYU6_RUBGE|nr:hypothetical protein [Rubrivivax gelatinosus]TCO96866.1 hypothetical protein EV684_1283 [Rubrivivax gelatinosus]
MQIQGIGGELRLRLLHRTPSQRTSKPDLHIQCSAKTSLFLVEASNAWLEWPDVEAFIAELEALNRDLNGKVELYAMSPEDFNLTIENLDSKGHIGVSFTIGSRNHTDNGQFTSSVTGGFEVLPSEIEAVLMWFKATVADENTA